MKASSTKINDNLFTFPTDNIDPAKGNPYAPLVTIKVTNKDTRTFMVRAIVFCPGGTSEIPTLPAELTGSGKKLTCNITYPAGVGDVDGYIAYYLQNEYTVAADAETITFTQTDGGPRTSRGTIIPIQPHLD